MNMDWVGHELALPRLPRGMSWRAAFSTEDDGKLQADRAVSQEETAGEQKAGKVWEEPLEAESAGLLKKLAPRSLAVYVGDR